MSRGRSFDVVVLGGINTDYVVRGESLPKPGQTVQGETFYIGNGGKGANQALAATRLGARTALIGRVGTDERGRELLRCLKREGVDTKHVSIDAKLATGAAIIAVNECGEKQIAAALGANLGITKNDIDSAERLIASARVLLMQFEAPLECVLRAAEIAADYGTQVILDPAPPRKVPRKLLRLLDVIRPNSDEAEKITGCRVTDRTSAKAAAQILLRAGVRIVAMESGDGGDLVVSQEEEIFVRKIKVKSVDATGAGDAFAGAFAVGLAEALPLKDVAELANATAALSTTRIGAQEGLPTRAEVERLLRNRKKG